MSFVRTSLIVSLIGLLSACAPTETSVEVNELGVTTPDTTGIEQTAAEQLIRDTGLRIGTVTTQSSDDIPIGSVVRTNPPAGTVVLPESTVNIVVSSGTASVVVPETAGSTETAAGAALVSAGLEVAAVLSEANINIPAGEVVRTIPAAGTSLARGSGVTLVLSTGPADVSVPDVTNLAEAQAAMNITDATLVVGTVTGEASDIVPFGNVIEQAPVGGAMVSANSAVDITISLGPANIAVPDLAGLSEAQATAALAGLGLIIGETTTEANVDVAAGGVITQDPAPATLVAATTAVNLVISAGANPLPVPNIVGLSEDQAIAVIPNAGLEVGVITRRFDNVIPQFEIISQGTPPGTLVQPDTTLDFLVSQGPPVPTPNLIGLLRADAEAAILAANLVVGEVTEANDFVVPEGSVISQDPNGGLNVAEGTLVNFVVSLGPPTVAVPNVVGLTQAAATTALTNGELTVGNVTTQNSMTVPAGVVISQTPVAAEIAIVGSAVDLLVSLGPVTVNVPDISGVARGNATSVITADGLTVGAITTQSSDTVATGYVISQNPLAGVSIPEGDAVAFVVSTGPAVDSFSDEFAIDSLLDWSIRHQVETTVAQYTTLDINQTTPGELTLVPTQTPGWFANDDAPLVFKTLNGDFAVHVRVLADSVTSPGQAPASNFNSAGLMARDAAGISDPENHVMVNIGRQDNSIAGGVGSETKDTVDGTSTLILAAGANAGDLVLCRIGDQFYTYRLLTGDPDWIETASFARPDLPLSLQVGMVVSAFSAPADLRATFEFIRLLPAPVLPADCTP